MGYESLSIVARALNPGLVAAWLVLSGVLAILRLNDVQAGVATVGFKKDDESRLPIRRAWIIEPLMLALLFVTASAVWQQATGEFIPFAEAWPSAIVMGFAFALMFVVFVNLQERTSVVASTGLLIFATIPGSLFFALAFFVMPWPLRWQWSVLGF